jgi:hypothetical protein
MDVAAVKQKIKEASPKDVPMWEKVLATLESRMPAPTAPTPVAPGEKPKRIIKPPTRTKTITPTDDGDTVPDADTIFQAVGCLVGDVIFKAEKKSVIVVDGKEYPLLAPYEKEKKKAFYALKKEIERTGKTMQKVIVYPKVIHFPSKDDPHIIAFQLIGFIGTNKPQPNFDLKDREFILKGLWQFVPVCKTPVVTVFKNFTEERLVTLKEMDLADKVKFMKAVHVPLLWRDASVNAFRYNPRTAAKKEGDNDENEVERDPTFFVSVKARFLPNRDVFACTEELSKPARNAPRAFRASKKLKAEFVKQKRGK